ncbi:unnamed protein product [Natator depressus]
MCFKLIIIKEKKRKKKQTATPADTTRVLLLPNIPRTILNPVYPRNLNCGQTEEERERIFRHNKTLRGEKYVEGGGSSGLGKRLKSFPWLNFSLPRPPPPLSSSRSSSNSTSCS